METNYCGTELELFAQATNWKNYLYNLLRPHLGRTILEVGAGIGGTTFFLAKHAAHDNWTCLEPDSRFADILTNKIVSGLLPGYCSAVQGTLQSFKPGLLFDTVLFIDVLEHIEDDRSELERAISCLSSNGRLIILSPAFNLLFSPFDKSVGHFRRYSKRMFIERCPSNSVILSSSYIDSFGFFASLANKVALRHNLISLQQVMFWDRFLVPISVLFDSLFGSFFGKSILTVYKKGNSNSIEQY